MHPPRQSGWTQFHHDLTLDTFIKWLLVADRHVPLDVQAGALF